jgi:hypothetical protein
VTCGETVDAVSENEKARQMVRFVESILIGTACVGALM